MWWYDQQFLRFRVLQTEIINYGNLHKMFRQVLRDLHSTFYTRPLTTRKIKTLKKRKNYLEMSSFYKCLPKTTITWCMLPEIWSATNIIFCHLGTFFDLLPYYWPWKLKFWKNVEKTWRYYPLHMCTINEDHIMYVSWDIKAQLTQFFVISSHFCSLILLTTRKIKVLKKIEKARGDILILRLCTTSDNHMMYGFWPMERGRQIFLSLSLLYWNYILHFSDPDNPSNQNC